MEFDLVVNDDSVERCFLQYAEIGYGEDIDENGLVVECAETTIEKVTWYKDNQDVGDVDDIVTVIVQEVRHSSPKVTIIWHDETFKNNIHATRLLDEAKKELLRDINTNDNKLKRTRINMRRNTYDILNVKERDAILSKLTAQQQDYLSDHIRRGKKTVFANEMAKSKGIVLPDNATANEIELLLDDWQLIDYIDNGFVNPETPCECGKPLRYQYVVKHKKSNEIRRFGIVHFEEHTNIPSQIVAAIKKGFASIDYELDELLVKIDNNWNLGDVFNFIPDGFVFPKDVKDQLDRGLPLLDRQIKRVRFAINEFVVQQDRQSEREDIRIVSSNSLKNVNNENLNLELELFQETEEKTIKGKKGSFRLENMSGYQFNTTHYRAIEKYLEMGITSARIICEMLIKDQLAPQNRYITGKPKIYVLVCYFLESLVENGSLEFEADFNKEDRKYSLKK